MALQFNRLEPVIIDKKECQPEPTPEARRRLQMAHIEPSGERTEVAEAIARCFPKEYDFVLKSVKDFMTDVDINILQAYLIGGERGVKQIIDASEKLADRQLDAIIEATK